MTTMRPPTLTHNLSRIALVHSTVPLQVRVLASSDFQWSEQVLALPRRPTNPERNSFQALLLQYCLQGILTLINVDPQMTFDLHTITIGTLYFTGGGGAIYHWVWSSTEWHLILIDQVSIGFTFDLQQPSSGVLVLTKQILRTTFVPFVLSCSQAEGHHIQTETPIHTCYNQSK